MGSGGLFIFEISKKKRSKKLFDNNNKSIILINNNNKKKRYPVFVYLIIRLRFIESTILVVVHVVAKVSLHEIGSDFGQLFFLYLMVSLYAGHGAYTYEKVFFFAPLMFLFFYFIFFLVLKKKKQMGGKKRRSDLISFCKRR